MRNLQTIEPSKWHQEIRTMTRNVKSDLCISVPGIEDSEHGDIANYINDAFVNPRPTKGVVTTPLTVCLRPHKNSKESDPGHLGHLFYILCRHFDEKKNWGYPLRWGESEPSKFEASGVGCHLKIF